MGRHTDAVEATITAAGDALGGKHQALCELVRTLAEQADATGPEGPGTRLAGTYLTAVRTLNAVMASTPSQPDKPQSSLAAVRGIRDGRARPRVSDGTPAPKPRPRKQMPSQGATPA